MNSRFLRLNFLMACCCTMMIASAASTGLAQDEGQPKKAAEATTDDLAGATTDDDKEVRTYVKQIEPGVKVLGVASRFAEVGQSSSFDSSPDGSQLAFASSSKIKFFDLEENKVTDTIGEKGEHYQYVRYSPDGRLVFAGGQRKGKGLVRVYDAIDKSSQGTITTEVKEEEKEGEKKRRSYFYLQSMFVSTDATYIGLCSHDTIQIREVTTGDLIYQDKGLGYVQGACFSPDEQYVIYPKNYKMVVVDIKTGEQQKKEDFPLVGQRSYSVTNNIATNSVGISTTNSISIFPMGEENREPKVLPLPKGTHAQPQVAFSDDGKLVAGMTWSQSKLEIFVLNTETKEVVAQIPAGGSHALNCRFADENQVLLLSGNGINGVKEISLKEAAEVRESDHPSGPATRIKMHPAEEKFLTTTAGGEVSWFDMKTGDVERSLSVQNISSVDFDESGSNVLLSAQWQPNKGIETYNFETGEPVKEYSVPNKSNIGGSVVSQFRRFMRSENKSIHTNQYSLSACYSVDRTKIYSLAMTQRYIWESEGGIMFGMFGNRYSGSQKNEMFLTAYEFDIETGKRKQSPLIPNSQIGITQEHQWPSGGIPSPLGDQFAVAQNQKLYLIDTQSGENICEIEAGEARFSRVRYSPDGRFVVANSSGDKRRIFVFNAADGEEVYQAEEKTKFAFSGDGRRMLVSKTSMNDVVEILDTKSWKPVFSREKTQDSRSSFALSKNGRKVLIGLKDCRVECWDLNRIAK